MKGDRYHDNIITIGKLQLIEIAEESRPHETGIYRTEQFFWIVFGGKYKIRWWRYNEV